MKKITFSSVFVMALLVTSGCSSDGAAQEEDRGASNVEVKAAETADLLAIAKVEDFATPDATAENARQYILQECMSERGFSWTYEETPQLKIDDLFVGRPLSLTEARAYGYDVPTNNTEEHSSSTSAAAQTAFMGTEGSETTSIDLFGSAASVTNDGCLAYSLERVYGSIENGMKATGLMRNALLPSMNGVNFDPSITDLYGPWETCMTEQGQSNLPNPDQAWLRAQSSPSDSASIAVADATCREQVGYDEKRREVAGKYLTTFLLENEALITEIQSVRSEGAVRGQEILASR